MAGATGTMLLRALLALSIAAACTGSGAIHKGKYTISKATFRRDLFLTNSPERSYVQLGVFGYGELGTCKITVTDTSEPRLKPEMLTGIASTVTPGIGFALFRINGSVVDLKHYNNLCSSNYTVQDGKNVFVDVLDRETLHDTLRVRLSKTSPPAAGDATPPATEPPAAGPTDPPATDPPAPVAPDCAAQHEEMLCTALKGCDWNEDGRTCTVSPPIDCSMAGDEDACANIAALGCKWAGAEGAAKACVADAGAARRAEALEVAADVPEVATYSGQVRITAPGHWALVFYKCGMKVTSDTNLKVVITEKNGDSFLQVGDAILPQFYVTLSLVFFVLLLKWAHWMKENKMHLHKIHFLMALTLVLKSAALLFEGLRYYYYRDHGDMSPLYDTMYYIFTIFKGTLVFSLVVLIGSGWSFLKPHLADRDKKVLMCVIPLQLSMSIVSIIIDEYSSGRPELELMKLQDLLASLSFLCCLVVLAPIMWSLKQLRSAPAADGKVARNLARLKQFRTLYTVVVAYLYFKTVVCDLFLAHKVSYENTWQPVVLSELSVLVSFVFVGIKFRPMKENPYTHLDEDDLDEGGHALDQEIQEMREVRALEGANEPYDTTGGIAADVTGSTDQRQTNASPPASTMKAVRRETEADF